MTTLIAFPTKTTAAVYTFPRASEAEAFALTLDYTTFVLGRVTQKSLAVLTTAQLLAVYNTAHAADAPVKNVVFISYFI